MVRAAIGVTISLPLLAVAWYVFPGNDAQVVNPTATAAPASAPAAKIAIDGIRIEEMGPMDGVAEIDEHTALQINTARPFDAKPDKPAAFRFLAGLADRDRATDCLAAAAFYEAGADRKGQQAVAQVVLNRVRHPAYPATVCAVVFEGAMRKTGCQFTFTCDGAMRRQPTDRQWIDARKVASEALGGAIDGDVGTATHYHASYVIPYWSGKLQKVAQVGAHIFYRWPGSFGSRGVFRNPGSTEEPQIAALASFGSHGLVFADAALEPALAAAADPVAPAAVLNGAGVAAPGPLVMQVNLAQPPGRWALQAMDRCSDKGDCQVVGYLPGGVAGERPAFLYTRDGNSGLDRALWNCRNISRPSSDQCLPESDSAVQGLMQKRIGRAAL